MFVLLDGAARVSIAMPDGEKREVAVLAAATSLGKCRDDGRPRTASVTSLHRHAAAGSYNESMELLLARNRDCLRRFSHVLAVGN